MKTRYCLTLLTLLCLSSLGLAQTHHADFFKVKKDIVTPHTKWADPYYGPPVKVLVIAPLYNQRHTVELMQRFNAQIEVFCAYSRSALGVASDAKHHQRIEGLMQPEKEAELDRLLEKSFDVIFIGVDWTAIPLKQLHLILRKVDRGTGLIVGYQQVGPRANQYYNRLFRAKKVDTSAILDGVPLAHTCGLEKFAAKPGSLLKGLRFGSGRVLQLNYERVSYTRREFMTPSCYGARRQDYEIQVSMAIRSILWCAKRLPPVNVLKVAPTKWDLKKAPPELAVTVKSADDLENAVVEAVWRNKDAEDLAKSDRIQSFKIGDNTIKLPTPELPAGTFFLDLRFIHDRKIVGWGSLVCEISSDLTIENIAYKKGLFAADSDLEATIKLSRAAPAKCVLKAVVKDVHGRILLNERQTVNPGEREIKLKYPLSRPFCVLHELQLTLTENQAPISRWDSEFHREWRRPDDAFQFVAWYGPCNNMYLTHLLMKTMADAGLDTAYLAHHFSKTEQYEKALPVARAGVSIFTYSTMTRNSELLEGNIRKPSLAAAKTRESYREWAQRSPSQLANLCPVGYSLGDENKFRPGGPKTDLDFHPESTADFRKWLKKKYGDIAALNKSWGGNLKSFDDVRPITLKDARKAKTPGPWIDFRCYMETQYSRHFHDQAEAMWEIDPKAKVGQEGWFYMNSYDAFDWWKMLRKQNMYVPYLIGRAAGEFVRSFKGPSFMGGYWFGAYSSLAGGRKPSSNRYFPWYSLSRGFNSAWFFNSYGRSGGTEFGLSGDFRPAECWRVATGECDEIKKGIDKLILNSERQDDGVAIYYSASSVHAATFYGIPVKHSAIYEDLVTRLRDFGISFKIVAYEQVANGELKKGKFKLLIMPSILSMSPAECEAVKEFVADGGSVIADFLPGFFDNSGKPYDPQPLSDLFGPQPKLVVRHVHGGKRQFEAKIGGQEFKFEFPHGSVRIGNSEPGTLVAAGKVGTYVAEAGEYQDKPLLLRSKAKNGSFNALSSPENSKITLLNFGFSLFNEKSIPQTKEIFSRLIAEAQINPPVKLELAQGETEKPVELSLFKRGDAKFALVIADLEGVEVEEETSFPLTLTMTEPAHIYDIRRKRYLGKQNKLNLLARSCQAELLAFLPYMLGRLDAQVENVQTDKGDELKITGKLFDLDENPVPDNHVIVIRIFSPDGKEQKHYMSERLTEDGDFEATIPMAENDPEGLWQITLEDVVSGTKNALWVNVGKRE